MFWTIQTIGLVICLLTILSFFNKEKWKLMIYFSATNICMIAVYLLSGSIVGGLLVFGALVRTIIYTYFNYKNKRPDTLIMILFQIYYIVITIIFWSDPIDLFMLVNLIVITYTSWQNNVKGLRFGYIFSAIMLVPYDILLGAYTTALSEIIMLCSVIWSLCRYAKIVKSHNEVVERYFNANKNFWKSSVTEYGDYNFVASKDVTSSAFYNFGIIKNQDNLLNTITEIKNKCKDEGLKEVAYLSFNPKLYNKETSNAHQLQMFFPTIYTDVWMKLIEGFNLNNTRCKIQDVEFREVDKSKSEQIAEVYVKGYLGKKDESELTEEEKIEVANLKSVDYQDSVVNGFRTCAYIAYYHNIPISLVCVLTNGAEAYITKVSTLTTFRRKHIASSLMQYAIKSQRAHGVQEFILVTDKYSTNEKFYSFNSFVEFGQGFALDVSDISKYEDFVNDNKID